MRIALASQSFTDRDTQGNLQVVLHAVEALPESADVICFGEMFLQGFGSLCWDYKKGRDTALSQEDEPIACIRAAAKRWGVAVCFGYVEKAGDALYSSQMFVGADGEIAENFRRVSPGWQEPAADAHYKEGAHFETFTYKGKTLAVALCGDLWQEGRPEEMNALHPDAVLWPVYCDYNAAAWNTVVKFEYARQAGLAGNNVLLVNSIGGGARGGAAHYWKNRIRLELPAGENGYLFANV